MDNNYTLENYCDALEKSVDNIAMEGFNADAKNEFSRTKRRYKNAVKEAKKYVKMGQPDKVAQKMNDAKAALQAARKTLDGLDNSDTVSSAIIGDLIVFLKFVGTSLLVLLGVSVGGSAAITGSIVASIMKSPDGTGLANGLTKAYNAGNVLNNANTIGQIVNAIRFIVSNIIRLSKAYIEKKNNGEKMSPNDFNMYFRKIVDSFDNLIKHCDKVKEALVNKANKKKAKLAGKAATEAALAGDLVTATEGMIAMISYLNGEDYIPETDAGYAVESAIECACFEEEFLETATE